MTSALRETLRRVTNRATDRILTKQFALTVAEGQNSVLLSAPVKSTCFARILTIVRCVTRLHVSNTRDLSRRFCVFFLISCVTDYTVYQDLLKAE